MKINAPEAATVTVPRLELVKKAGKQYAEDFRVSEKLLEEIIIGFPVWAANIAPPIRTFVYENKELLKGKRISAFACQGGSGAEKAFGKLRSLLEIDDFFSTAVFIDPKDRQSEGNKVRLDTFIKKLKEND